MLAAALPLGWFLADTWRGYALLIGAVIFVMIVEVLNTAVEAACNAVSRDFRPDIRIAKDCGSLAVLLSILIAGGIWALAIAERIAGHAL